MSDSLPLGRVGGVVPEPVVRCARATVSRALGGRERLGLQRVWEAGRSGVGPQRQSGAGRAPNKGVQATASSLRSFLAAASSGA